MQPVVSRPHNWIGWMSQGFRLLQKNRIFGVRNQSETPCVLPHCHLGFLRVLIWEWAKGQADTCFNHWAGVTKAHLWKAKLFYEKGNLKAFFLLLQWKWSYMHSTTQGILALWSYLKTQARPNLAPVGLCVHFSWNGKVWGKKKL